MINVAEMERRLTALKQSLCDILGGACGDTSAYSDVKSFFQDYASIRRDLRREGGKKYVGIPECRHDSYDDPYGGKRVRNSCLNALLRGVNHALTVIPDATPVSEILGREGFFFRGQSFEALLAATRIIESATRTVDIIDGYFTAETLGLLQDMKRKAQIRILTRTIDDKFSHLARAYIKDGGRLEVRTSMGFHDRFVIVDGKDYYHFGASLKNLGERGFMYSRIEEPVVVDALRKTVERVWSEARVAFPSPGK
jgi:hypothetical protein